MKNHEAKHMLLICSLYVRGVTYFLAHFLPLSFRTIHYSLESTLLDTCEMLAVIFFCILFNRTRQKNAQSSEWSHYLCEQSPFY